MRNRIRSTAALAAVTIAAGAGLVGLAGPAHAAQMEQTVTCPGGQDLTVRVNTNNSQNGGWAAAQIVAGGTGHLVPTTFSGSLTDDITGQTVFSFAQVKGGGHANQNQSAITCTQTTPGTLGDFLDPGQAPPTGTSVTDPVTFHLTVTAVPHS